MGQITLLLRRARRIHQTEGPTSLLRRGFAFALRQVFEYRSVWLYEYSLETVRQVAEADVMPRTADFAFHTVETNPEADELEAEGYEFRSYPFFIDARKALDRGAVAFCVFVGPELASIAWSALSQEAKDSFGEPPARVDFANHEAWTGGVWTNPRYRRMRLRTYRAFRTRQYLLDHGIAVQRSQVSRRNVANIRAAATIGEKVYAEGRYLRILWWRSWKEWPLTPE